MKDNLNSVLENIIDKLVEVLHYVNEYEFIFNNNTETQKVITDTKSRFFNDLYWLYWNFMTIRICALLDKPAISGKENLTIPKLLDIISELNFKCLPKTQTILNEILDKLKPFRTVRNKAFGHFDLDTITSKKALKIIKLDDLISICYSIGIILNEIENEMGNGTSLYGIKSLDGTKRLIYILN